MLDNIGKMHNIKDNIGNSWDNNVNADEQSYEST